MDTPGNLFVVSAPSGSGKSSLVNALMEVDHRVAPSVSHTTRPPRGQDKNGREYFFVDRAAFDAMIEAGDFLEWAEVHGHRYGTTRQAIQARIAGGGDVVLEIDWQGAMQIRRLFASAVLIFVLPPSWEELHARLTRRGEDAADTIALRLENAKAEFKQVRHFDYVIINSSFERALFDLKAIVHAQRLRYSQQKQRHAGVFGALGVE